MDGQKGARSLVVLFHQASALVTLSPCLFHIALSQRSLPAELAGSGGELAAGRAPVRAVDCCSRWLPST